MCDNKCDYCGKEFEQPAFIDKHGHYSYCSKECLLKHCASTHEVCSFCGKPFNGKVIYDIDGLEMDYIHGFYCSEECFCRAWKEHAESNEWKESWEK